MRTARYGVRNHPVAPGTERILLVGSSGGHLAQLLALEPWWAHQSRAWVTFKTPDAEFGLRNEQDVTWAYSPTTRNIPNLLRNSKLAWSLMRQFRPTVVISTGAGSALPFFALAKMMSTTTVYIEVYDRVDSPTLTGRLCRPFTDLMLVQWRDQLGLYRDAHVLGRLL
ncbi:UDP-N-acetylglucosamine--LPS N-acetylglucosamine transferase [Arthrobacter sp.]|uniref:UDP-N-acetylglucosamine--LPS N-acetylglucosamine transferase n=1 Tax=Arthrobacter sp. TaxID=1667 RepID=UPI00281141F5|nr:UDP-N-acetylglucosamine--LPS N-acetylglucosamine transferase [Arthrobacter sp.]